MFDVVRGKLFFLACVNPPPLQVSGIPDQLAPILNDLDNRFSYNDIEPILQKGENLFEGRNLTRERDVFRDLRKRFTQLLLDSNDPIGVLAVRRAG